MEKAAAILTETFKGLGKDAWPTREAALDEVRECVEEPNICIGIFADGELAGWGGLRPMYDKTWELHPLVIAGSFQGRGLGRLLLSGLETRAVEKGITGIVLGTDDETGSTSLSQRAITGENIFEEIIHIRNLKNHPFEFYRKCGYIITGIVPDANGEGRPDIWMWKKLRRPETP
ncbi:GNAT family N-acetyltransferase [Brucepastera parasyntrophica]|uniref:GNAT family N-acetyltransferase n=1 Tax=Brucepastera parasyntrophica TaxID=2880008 RepID=UPI003F71B20B